jgi:hypothetical protein
LQTIKDSTPFGAYYIVYAAKGTGKSELTTHVAQNRKATVKVSVYRGSKQKISSPSYRPKFRAQRQLFSTFHICLNMAVTCMMHQM